MSKIIINKSLYTHIANTLRSEGVISGNIHPPEMATKVSDLLTQQPDYTVANDGTITFSKSVTKIYERSLGTDFNKSSSIPIVIPISNNIQEISFSAFIGCRGFTESLNLPFATKIDDYAFYGSNITELSVGGFSSSITTLGTGCFGNTDNLQYAFLYDCSGGFDTFMAGAPNLQALYIEGDNSYCPTGFLSSYWLDSAKACCPSLKEVVLRGGTFEQGCFDDYASTIQLKMFVSKNVKEIQDYAFCIGKNIAIYTDATTRPDGWSENWYKYIDVDTDVEIENSVFYGVDYMDYLGYVYD